MVAETVSCVVEGFDEVFAEEEEVEVALDCALEGDKAAVREF